MDAGVRFEVQMLPQLQAMASSGDCKPCRTKTRARDDVQQSKSLLFVPSQRLRLLPRC
jgi:hypothetical protein